MCGAEIKMKRIFFLSGKLQLLSRGQKKMLCVDNVRSGKTRGYGSYKADTTTARCAGEGVHVGLYRFGPSVVARFTFVVRDGRIVHHHSSKLPQ